MLDKLTGMEYTIIWKEHFRKKNEDRYVTIKRDYPDIKATKTDAASYVQLRTTQGYAHESEDKLWTDKRNNKTHKIIEHAFTDGNNTFSMWIGPSLLA